jgi:hypothetical protein
MGDVNKMLLNYYLSKINLPNSENLYSARVRANGSIGDEAITDEMLAAGTMATRTDIVGVRTLNEHTIVRWLKRGYSVKTGLVTFNISVRGTFNGKKDIFDPARHQLVVTVSPGPLLANLEFEVESATKVDAPSHTPNPVDLTDHESETTNTILTPGGTAQLEGRRLKFDPSDPTQGVFLINGVPGSETRVERLMDHKPSMLWFKIPPELAPGTYRLEVRVGTGDQGDIIAGRLPKTLTVNPA